MALVALKKCPRCGGSLAIDRVAEFSGCISCGYEPSASPPTRPVHAGKWAEVLADGKRLGWEATAKKWSLGKTAKKRLKHDLQEKPGQALSETMIAMGTGRKRRP